MGYHTATVSKAKKNGFTLIELLVVISIIGFLSSVVYASLSSTRERGRVSSAMKTNVSLYRTLGAEALGIWDLNDGTGSSAATDASEYRNHGTLINAPQWLCTDDPDDPPTPYHVIGRGDGMCSMVFNGVNQSVETDLHFGVGDFTLSLWVYIDPAMSSQSQAVLTSNRHNGGRHYFGAQPDQRRTFWFSAGWNSSSLLGGEGRLSFERWHHVVYTLNGNTRRIYLDGKLDAERTHTTAPHTNGRFFIARDNPTANYFNGRITDVRIYGQALTASEVQKLYAEGARRFMAVNESEREHE